MISSLSPSTPRRRQPVVVIAKVVPDKVGRVTPCAPGSGFATRGAHGVTRPTSGVPFRKLLLAILIASGRNSFRHCRSRRHSAHKRKYPLPFSSRQRPSQGSFGAELFFLSSACFNALPKSCCVRFSKSFRSEAAINQCPWPSGDGVTKTFPLFKQAVSRCLAKVYRLTLFHPLLLEWSHGKRKPGPQPLTDERSAKATFPWQQNKNQSLTSKRN